MLRVIGAGLPRTGTMTLKNALETLLGAPCHHMAEVFGRVETDAPAFSAAAEGDFPDWDEVFKGYAAAVDWPASAFYAELAERYPDAVVVLSRRDSFEAWWTSANNTVFKKFNEIEDPSGGPWLAMVEKVWDYAFEGAERADKAAVEAAYHRYHDKVRATVPADRLVEFGTGAGWEPLCTALGLPIPDQPFPHLNSTKDFHAQIEQIVTGKAPE
ncbi:sulfotransferase family protein [Glycomyces sp. TRM65418]|uniref:sulfotransferase family protein n=1 Tax=Glycomyces sp. TRM65418 TaxID=2867006 RepID=UPI001CE56297|nr:sulfotransferase family protein [Glycomyces sp. TRM65418]MCC3765388.1 sulfotransferase family protein [Glycomyces sp. TRM65418]QZD55002.1 sulfotransferase family protein [Glycomyces sp. TRM65418]